VSETEGCENCGSEVGEQVKKGFTFYKGFRLCMDCYAALQPHMLVEVDKIHVPSVRLRSRFDEETAQQFSDSVAEHGVLVPIYVFKDESGNFWLADGLHRLNELKSMRRKFAPAIIREGGEVDAAIASARLNMLRGKVNYAELAKLIVYLKDQCKWTVRKICKEIGLRSAGYVSSLYKLAKSRPDLLKEVEEDQLSIHAAIEQLSCSTVEHTTHQARSEEDGAASSTVETEMVKPLIPTSVTRISVEKISPALAASESNEEQQPLTLEELVSTPIQKSEKDKEAFKDRRGLACAYCGLPFTKEDSESDRVSWIPVHRDEKSLALDVLEKARAEREGRNALPSLGGEANVREQ